MAVNFEPGNIPDELRERDQWLLWDDSHDTPRQPHWAGDFTISWSDPDDWHSFDEAVEHASRVDSWGIGYVMALDNPNHPRGLHGCLDLDGCLRDNNKPKEWLPSLERFISDGAYIERSPSGDGLHIPLVGQQAPDWWTDSHFSEDEHEGVEYLTHKFVTFTGNLLVDELQPDGVAETNPAPFLFDAFETLNGESPRVGTESDDSHDDHEWSEDEVAEMLDHCDSSCSYPRWRDLAFSVHDWDSGATGKRLFEQFSRGSGWDDQSQDLINAIWSGADRGSGITVGTLVHRAKQGGWEPQYQQTPDRPDDTATADDNGPDLGLDRDSVAIVARLDEDEAIRDLTDREKAAAVWEIIVRSDDAHVRVRRDNGSIWACENGIWERSEERALAHAARRALGSMNYGQNVLSELQAQARSDPRAELDAGKMGVDPGVVAVENGLLDLQAAAEGRGEDALRPLEPGDFALSRLPVEFDADAEAARWREFVGEVVERDKIEAVQEFIGYTLHRGGMPHNKALLLVGSGANGKSTFLNTVRELLGSDHTTTKPVHKFDSDNHVADLYGSVANIDADMSEGSLSKEGIAAFKRLVGGDEIDARKLYEDAFSFSPTAKHLYACNQVPDVSTYVADADIAFWRRWIVVEFPNWYPEGSERRDPDLEDKLQTEESLSGILNWAIAGWHKLMQQGGFTDIESYSETRHKWQQWGDSVEKFVAECAERNPDADRIRSDDVHSAYQKWCRMEDEDAIGFKDFIEDFNAETPDVGHGTHRFNGKPLKGYNKLELIGIPEDGATVQEQAEAEADSSPDQATLD